MSMRCGQLCLYLLYRDELRKGFFIKWTDEGTFPCNNINEKKFAILIGREQCSSSVTPVQKG